MTEAVWAAMLLLVVTLLKREPQGKRRAVLLCLLTCDDYSEAEGRGKSDEPRKRRATFSFYSRSLYDEAEGRGESEDRKAAFVLLAFLLLYLRYFFVLLV